jgi:hypothetical protein
MTKLILEVTSESADTVNQKQETRSEKSKTVRIVSLFPVTGFLLLIFNGHLLAIRNSE